MFGARSACKVDALGATAAPSTHSMALSATTTSADATHTHRTDKGSHLHPTATYGRDRTRTTCTAVARTTLHAASISSMRASSGIIRSRSLGSPLNLPFPSGSPAPAQAVTLAPVSHRNARRRAGQMGRGGCAGEDGLTSLAEAGQIRFVVIALASCCAHCQHLRHGCTNCESTSGQGHAASA